MSRAGDGDWAFVGDSFINNDSIYGQINLRTITTAGITRDVQLGDGTYTASIRLSFSDYRRVGRARADQRRHHAFVDAPAATWCSYAATATSAIYKAGVGQVVADVPTGSIPWRRAYRVRVVKTGPNFQVYVEDQPDPLINWTDTNASAWGIGGFGVANRVTRSILITDDHLRRQRRPLRPRLEEHLPCPPGPGGAPRGPFPPPAR